jgi:uncharacterized membrane protein
MTGLIAAASLFLGIHLLVSGTKLRDTVTSAIGEKVYLPLFALSSLGAIVWLCFAYNHASASPQNFVLFDAGQTVRNCALPVLFLAFVLGVPGVLMGNPTSAGQDKAEIRGVLRITRHPFLWGVTLWSGFHLIGAGTLAATILFATFLLLAALGTRAIDGKVRRKRPQDWQRISAQTSNLPFAAIATGRGRLVASEYFDWRFSVAVLLFAAFTYFHNTLFSLSPFPNNWLPG